MTTLPCCLVEQDPGPEITLDAKMLSVTAARDPKLRYHTHILLNTFHLNAHCSGFVWLL